MTVIARSFYRVTSPLTALVVIGLALLVAATSAVTVAVYEHLSERDCVAAGAIYGPRVMPEDKGPNFCWIKG